MARRPSRRERPIVWCQTLDQLTSNLGAAEFELPKVTDRLEQLSRPVPDNIYPYGDIGVALRQRFLDKGAQVTL